MAQTEPPQKTSRAGRDLPAAITVGVVLGALAIGTLLFAPIWWLPLLAVAIAIATHEVIRRMREHDYALPTVPLLLGGQAMIWLTWPFGTAGLLGAYGGTIVVCMVWRLIGQGLDQQPVNYLRDIAATVLLATWVPMFAAFTALLIFADHGGARVFIVIVTVVFADIGGYVAGVLFGKHLLAPAISPKKSWEGLGGSLLFGVSAAVLSVAFLLDKPAWVGVPLGLLLVITGVLGDLVESQVKRDLGIKDMGTLLPGHGGIMDRIDAMLPSAVVGWIVLTLLA
ncbi:MULTISPECIES: phosphatidate cytidylyltransferase [unclassified Mycolicibacterium]|uniref:phosphatidate cytidylyltransferase n=1 Tax=unclassified Mycolicibacterium TaxID=2636767 RepID=UPI001305CB07|nr:MULTISPECIES: phosphatidate cytidylyltransferase [unclassified Mycolicibacterium]MUL80477.1 phosphatidate cytidylyltransferase [Mycolicibacterium sp. CBMA 329]MUL86244.1 phosphatidate cytidylyltransferase [Mycolicibacterium sp. CBMA 331]MUM01094.1 phosphatidate cytidylyltransferase [Mycolicibacterium sp. CBMA 334]MUM24987.1 phosphatidate cytidylyltransferase [Mycolicibacterium sp. CBMA 295]MUM36540.1 phosphatidate cytidylyltransferase [Mycolicibacterium sp. CBMA 247]